MAGPSRPPFQPGESGNPSGRPKKTPEMRQAEENARAASPEMVAILVEIARNGEDEKARLMAADKVLDRALGKPVQAIAAEVEHKSSGESTQELVRGEVLRMLGQLVRPAEVVESTAEVAGLPGKVES